MAHIHYTGLQYAQDTLLDIREDIEESGDEDAYDERGSGSRARAAWSKEVGFLICSAGQRLMQLCCCAASHYFTMFLGFYNSDTNDGVMHTGGR